MGASDVERCGFRVSRTTDINSFVSQKQQYHVHVAFLASNVKRRSIPCIFCIHVNMGVLEKDFHDLKMSKAAGTMKRGVFSLRSNPIQIDSWVIGEEIHKSKVAGCAGIPQLLFFGH